MDLGPTYPDHVPWPSTEWDEIIPGLYMGGHDYRVGLSHFTTSLKGISLFDHVVSLYVTPWIKQTVPPAGIGHTVFEIPDGRIENSWEPRLHEVARMVADMVQNQGKTVLVRCQAGYNRSGLVVALALMNIDWSAAGAIALIRDKRSPWALHNREFVGYLHELEQDSMPANRLRDPHD